MTKRETTARQKDLYKCAREAKDKMSADTKKKWQKALKECAAPKKA
jgi:hypothetical protein